MADQVHVSLQDVIRCDLCDTPLPTKHCDVCDIHLCEECEGKHTSDESKEHVVVSFRMRGSTPKCSKHSTEICARYCGTCNTLFCASCDFWGNHNRHKTEHISKMSDYRKEPGRNYLLTGTNSPSLKMVLEIIIPFICIIIIYYGIKYCFILSVVPDGKIHLWIIVIVLEAILTLFLQDFLFCCMKHVCGLDFVITHFFEYLKWLMTRFNETRTFNLQTATNFTQLKNEFKLIISFICMNFIDYGVRYFLLFSVVPGQKIHLWLIVAVLNAILLFFLVDFLFFCLNHVCGLNFREFGYLFEYLRWLMTRIKESKEKDLQTTNVTFPKMSGIGFMDCVCFYVIFCVVVNCLGFISFHFFYILPKLQFDILDRETSFFTIHNYECFQMLLYLMYDARRTRQHNF